MTFPFLHSLFSSRHVTRAHPLLDKLAENFVVPNCQSENLFVLKPTPPDKGELTIRQSNGNLFVFPHGQFPPLPLIPVHRRLGKEEEEKTGQTVKAQWMSDKWGTFSLAEENLSILKAIKYAILTNK